MLATERDGVTADLYILGKALSGGLYPISALVGRNDVLELFTAGTHGSTFGGNPLAAAIGEAALKVLLTEKLAQRSQKLGAYFVSKLKTLRHPKIKEVRGRGLMMALEFTEPVRPLVLDLMARGLLAKDTHENTIRLAPPLVINQAQLDAAFRILSAAVAAFPQ
jgi:ornithine--oxo-acid transaminase